ncbi:2OG-Fe(II) oxygenase [Acinetobacter larvae]|uniref:Oxidoreductase n=1 Tax=Acinetobacter larvae TaxID=1789224 RepID=A0A1B2M2H1_9GAMM|nr:2OG-Fe(II) oxygenase [Acinetobacter larvae]AOA59388.1 oxidoreductase [Acinetobacter larvae]
MSEHVLPESYHIDHILDALEQQGFAIVDDVYTPHYCQNLQEECTSHLNQFREAAIQHGVVSRIRSDQILWIDESFPCAQQHLQNLKQLSQHFNQNFFLGINEVEAHFACYDAGQFYARHRDNPQAKNDRIISAVYYLHDTWHADWGGQLHLQDKQQHWHILQPKANRLVLFQSDLLHEVFIAQHQRLSITAWLRCSRLIE